MLGDNKTCVNWLQEPLPAALAQKSGIFVGNEHKSIRMARPERCVQLQLWDLPVPVLGGRVLGPLWGHDLHPTTSVQLEVI